MAVLKADTMVEVLSKSSSVYCQFRALPVSKDSLQKTFITEEVGVKHFPFVCAIQAARSGGRGKTDGRYAEHQLRTLKEFRRRLQNIAEHFLASVNIHD
jgi:hypothetical protein